MFKNKINHKTHSFRHSLYNLLLMVIWGWFIVVLPTVHVISYYHISHKWTVNFKKTVHRISLDELVSFRRVDMNIHQQQIWRFWSTSPTRMGWLSKHPWFLSCMGSVWALGVHYRLWGFYGWGKKRHSHHFTSPFSWIHQPSPEYIIQAGWLTKGYAQNDDDLLLRW